MFSDWRGALGHAAQRLKQVALDMSDLEVRARGSAPSAPARAPRPPPLPPAPPSSPTPPPARGHLPRAFPATSPPLGWPGGGVAAPLLAGRGG